MWVPFVRFIFSLGKIFRVLKRANIVIEKGEIKGKFRFLICSTGVLCISLLLRLRTCLVHLGKNFHFEKRKFVKFKKMF